MVEQATLEYSYEFMIDRVSVAMKTTATLSSKFQISIPKAIREEMQWKAGQEFVFIPKGTGVLVMPVPDLDDLQGIARRARKDDYRDRQDRY